MSKAESRAQRRSTRSDSEEDERDEAILAAHTEAIAVAFDLYESRPNLVACVGLACLTVLLPSFIFQAVVDLRVGLLLPLYLVFLGGSAALLVLSYQLFYQAQQHSNHVRALAAGTPPPTAGGKKAGGESSAEAVKRLQYHSSLGYALSFCNAMYILLALFLELYLLKAFDKRLNFMVSTLIAGGLVYWVSYENEKTVKGKKLKKK